MDGVGVHVGGFLAVEEEGGALLTSAAGGLDSCQGGREGGRGMG